jgi:hypothetical protein
MPNAYTLTNDVRDGVSVSLTVSGQASLDEMLDAMRGFTDPDKMKRDVPRYFNPAERRADIVKYIRANGLVTVSDLCEWTGADIGTVGSDVRTLKREGRIVWAGWDRIPSGGKQKLWRLADAEQT